MSFPSSAATATADTTSTDTIAPTVRCTILELKRVIITEYGGSSGAPTVRNTESIDGTLRRRRSTSWERWSTQDTQKMKQRSAHTTISEPIQRSVVDISSAEELSSDIYLFFVTTHIKNVIILMWTNNDKASRIANAELEHFKNKKE